MKKTLKDPNELTKEELVAVVRDVQDILWGDDVREPDEDHDWEVETIEYVAGALTDRGLGIEEEEA